MKSRMKNEELAKLKDSKNETPRYLEKLSEKREENMAIYPRFNPCFRSKVAGRTMWHSLHGHWDIVSGEETEKQQELNLGYS